MMIPKIADWKPVRVSELADILNRDGVVGIVDTTGVPATAMLGMRSSLRDQMTLTMAKKTLFKLAWKEAGLNLDMLEEFQNAAEEFGIPKTKDFNTGDNFGVGYFQFTNLGFPFTNLNFEIFVNGNFVN